MSAKKKSTQRKPKAAETETAIDNASPGAVVVTNTGNHNIFTDHGVLRPGECGECSREVADMLIDKGLADEIG